MTLPNFDDVAALPDSLKEVGRAVNMALANSQKRWHGPERIWTEEEKAGHNTAHLVAMTALWKALLELARRPA